jgi:UDP-N-acetylmuramate dehydrogenase
VHDLRSTLAGLTTLRLGGPARRVIEATDDEQILQIVRDATVRDEPILLLAGGSNVVIGDDGFDGTVVLLRSRGITAWSPTGPASVQPGESVSVRIAAGEPWDGVVAHAIAQGWSGIECLSGIPGSAGATPIQNVGAYGQEVAERVVSVRAYDRQLDKVVDFAPEECHFAYRMSIFKHSDRWVVLSVDLRLNVSGVSAPIQYAEVASALGVEIGDVVDLAVAREAVLKLRAGKGMLLDPADPDTYSAGSFFTNPVLSADAYAHLQERAARTGLTPPAFPAPDGAVKVSAGWLIQHAGFHKGYGGIDVAISAKHTLALTNRGHGTTSALLDLAREVRDGVTDKFGVVLHPEPVLINCSL